MGKEHKKYNVARDRSNVGKSIINAGFCRIFYQVRYSVAIQMQNGLVIYYEDGKEMGRLR